MPRSRQACMSAEVNGKIYVFGDFFGEFPMDIYDPITNTWEIGNAVPNATRGLAGIATLDNKIYFMGGYKESGQITFPDVDVYTILILLVCIVAQASSLDSLLA